MAMAPVVELRGALPFGMAQGLPVWAAYAASVLGNLVPVPFILLLIRRVFALLRRSRWLGGKVEALERRAHLKGRTVRKYRLPGLVLLVAVPLPGTGAWTGALAGAHGPARDRPGRADRRGPGRGGILRGGQPAVRP